MQERELGLSAEREAFLQWFGSRLHRVSQENWDRFSEEAHQMLRKYTTTTPATTITAPSAALGAPLQPAAGPPTTHQQQPWQWQQPQQQQQQPALPTPQWQQWPQQQQPQWPQPQWPQPQWQPTQLQPTQQQATQQQSTGQQPQQPDIQRPARSHSTPVPNLGQDDPLMDLSLPSILSGSFTPMLKGSQSQSEPLITPEPPTATSRSSNEGVQE